MPADALDLQHAQLTAARAGLVRDTYLTIHQVMKVMGASRSVVEAIPVEILPFVDVTPTSSRVSRRYNPIDVQLALEVLLPRYKEARARGEGNRFLLELREEREAYAESLLTRVRASRVA
jgi:hypothetical protein